MKKYVILGGVTLLTTALFSCKDNGNFTISGTFTNSSKSPTVYLQQADTTGQYKTIDSTQLSSIGTFKFKKQTPFANLYRLKIDTTQIDLAAQNGDVIKLDDDLTTKGATYTISGSDISKSIQHFNALAKGFTDRSNQFAAEFQSKSQANPKRVDSLTKALMPAYLKLQADFGDQALKFISSNRQTLAAFYAATTLDPVKFEIPLVNYADKIDAELQKNPVVKRFVDAMEAVKPLSVGHTAPDFTINSFNGKPVKLSDYKGKWVMVDFWASWCVPCRQENPNVLKQYQKFHDKGLNVLGVSLDKDKAAWHKAVKDDHLAWIQVSDLNSFQGSTEMLYHIEAIPSNYLIDPQGKIAAKNVRGVDLEDFLNKTLKKNR